MNITNARWADAAQTAVLATVDGAEMTIPADPANRHYARLLADAVEIVAAPTPSLDDRKEAKAALARVEGARRMRAATTSYTPEERDTWYQQGAEADAYNASATNPTPMLDAIAAQRGLTRAEMVAKVEGARALFAGGVGAILGAQQALEDAIKAAADDAALDAIDPTDPANWPS